jgi:glutamate dehydrogenase (NADP+)
VIGPERDIPAPDVGTDSRVMGWMADEYGRLTGRPAPAVVTGKPLDQGGSEGREDATSLGGFILLQSMRERLGLAGGERAAVQGLGAVGLKLGELMAEAGYRIVAVADSRTTLACADGLDMAAVAQAKRKGRPLAGLADGSSVTAGPPDAVLTADCEILAPAALENALTAQNADAVRARIVLEMANGPITAEAEERLAKRNVVMIPDVLANCGGVIVSYFEWLQNRQDQRWPLEEVNRRLAKTICDAGEAVIGAADTHGLPLRAAAYLHAVSRLAHAYLAPAGKSTLPAD